MSFLSCLFLACVQRNIRIFKGTHQEKCETNNSRIGHVLCSQEHRVQTGNNFTYGFVLPLSLLLSIPHPHLWSVCAEPTEQGHWGSHCDPLREEDAVHSMGKSLSVLLTQLNTLHMRRGKWDNLCERRIGLGMEPCTRKPWSKACHLHLTLLRNPQWSSCPSPADGVRPGRGSDSFLLL